MTIWQNIKAYLRPIALEAWARAQYEFLVLFGEDGWDMGADLYGSIFVFCGFWFNEHGRFRTYAESQRAGKP
jgi:hypothetical protein